MKYFVGVILVFMGNFAISQTTNIIGSVFDSSTGHALEGATIVLSNTNKQIKSLNTVANKNGDFMFGIVPSGSYKLTIKYIGFIPFEKNILMGDSSKSDLSFIVKLNKKGTELETVVVEANSKLIENKIDKIVYNVEKDITSQGGMATDALKKIPQVTVDADGNVELLGNPSVQFLINGKPSKMFGNSAADALQSIPNSQIQSIEVITSPSAKYEASGTGGIINIILKKNKMQGWNGNINVAAGSRLENGSFSFSWKQKNVGININFGGNAQLNAATPTGMDRLTSLASGNLRLLQESNPNFNRNGYKSGMEIEWAISKNDNVTTGFQYNHFAFNNDGLMNQIFTKYDPSNNVLGITNSVRNFTNKTYVNTVDNSLVFKHKFKKENQEIEIGFEGSFSGNNTFYNQTQNYLNSSAFYSGLNSLNPGKENAIDFIINYVQPINKEVTIETGFKQTFESILSNADVFSLNTTTNNYLKDITQSYNSEYRRNVYAAYVSATFQLLKIFDIKAGARYEHTSATATYSNSGSPSIPDYDNLAPSFIMSHSFNQFKTIKFAYNYRIERPDYRDLNPFYNLSDPHNIVTGNPNLQSEIGHNYELSFNQSFEKNANINFTLFYQRNSPDIKPYINYYPTFKIGDSTFTDVTLTTRANIAAEERTGISISASLPIGKKLTIRPNMQISNRKLNNPFATPNITDAFGFRGSLNATMQINADWLAEVFGNYQLGMKWLGRQASNYSYTLAARKQIWGKKASIGFVIVNPLNKYIEQTSQQLTQNIVSDNYRNLPYRSIGISFSYKFGKLKFTKQKDGDNYLFTPPIEN